MKHTEMTKTNGSPDEVESDNGRDFYLKSNKKLKISVGPSESMSKSKKNTIDPEKMINPTAQML